MHSNAESVAQDLEQAQNEFNELQRSRFAIFVLYCRGDEHLLITTNALRVQSKRDCRGARCTRRSRQTSKTRITLLLLCSLTEFDRQ